MVDTVDASAAAARYRGVRKRKWGKWVSEVRLPNSRKRIWLGSYDSAEKAARAFDAGSFLLRGRRAGLNFPDRSHEIAVYCSRRNPTPQQIQTAAARYAHAESRAAAAAPAEPVSRQAEESAELSPAIDQWEYQLMGPTFMGIDEFDYGLFGPLERMDLDVENNWDSVQCPGLWNF